MKGQKISHYKILHKLGSGVIADELWRSSIFVEFIN